MARKMNDPELEAQKKRITDLAIEVQEAVKREDEVQEKLKLELFSLLKPLTHGLDLFDSYSVLLDTLKTFDGARNDNFFKFYSIYINYKRINAQYRDVLEGGDRMTRRAILNENYENIVNS